MTKSKQNKSLETRECDSCYQNLEYLQVQSHEAEEPKCQRDDGTEGTLDELLLGPLFPVNTSRYRDQKTLI